MLEESNKRSSENHNCLTLDFDSSSSLGTLSRIEIKAHIGRIGACKGFFKSYLKKFFCIWAKFLSTIAFICPNARVHGVYSCIFMCL